MLSNKAKTISAQVILRPASGKFVTGQDEITSENIEDYMSEQETFDAAAQAFGEAGFEVSAEGPTGFAITAPASTFEEVFNTHLRDHEDGGTEVVNEDESASFELPLCALPPELSQHVEAVTFTPPPDFGLTEY